MHELKKIGILRETRNPPDRRVPLIPDQVIDLEKKYPFARFLVQPSDDRCYADDEYRNLDISIEEDLSGCDILMGVKEVDRNAIIPGKTYMFFTHVSKKQPHNRTLFKTMVNSRISVIDYEFLTTDAGERVVAFGRYAGLVGAYNALRAHGIRTGRFGLKPAYRCRDLDEMKEILKKVNPAPGLKIVITGNGRVAHGALETLNACNVEQVSPGDFLNRTFDAPVACAIGPEIYTRHEKGQQFSFSHFVKFPREYGSAFMPFSKVSDILITGHYWAPGAPSFFTRDDIKSPHFRISIIADISCDINGPVPSTLRASNIPNPFYDYNPFLEKEEEAFSNPSNITVMSIDNLPGELPRDASRDFGMQLAKHALPDLLAGNESRMIKRATILKNGELTPAFSYLGDYVDNN
jgi:alanine dehydrogenase